MFVTLQFRIMECTHLIPEDITRTGLAAMESFMATARALIRHVSSASTSSCPYFLPSIHEIPIAGSDWRATRVLVGARAGMLLQQRVHQVDGMLLAGERKFSCGPSEMENRSTPCYCRREVAVLRASSEVTGPSCDLKPGSGTRWWSAFRLLGRGSLGKPIN